MASDQNALEQAITQALSTVREPSGKSILDANLVVNVQGEDEAILVTCRNPGFPDPIRQRIEREIRSSIQAAVPQLGDVRVAWETQDPHAHGHSHGHSHEHGHSHGEPAAPPALDIKHVIAVGSGKGGVGKSTIAASLAYALKHRGNRVGLMDADVYGPSIPHMLGLSGQPKVANNRYQPLVADEIKVISMGFLVPPNQAVVWRGPMLHKAVRDFLYAVEWGSLDYLVVDLPPGTGDVVLSLSQQMPIAGGVIVCTPQDVALLDARKALNMLQTVKIPCQGVVENMSFFLCPSCGSRSEIFGHGGAKHWAEEAGVPFLGSVPINLAVRINGDSGNVRSNFADDNPVRQSLLDIADRLVANIESAGGPSVPTLEIVG